MKGIIGVAAALAGIYALQHGNAALVLVLVVVVLLAGRTVGRVVTVHTAPGDRRDAAVHEAGHLAVGRHVGGEVISAQIWSDGSGIAKVRTYDALSDIAVSLGGAAAEGSDRGAAHDHRSVARTLEGVPAGERDRLLAAAQREVRRALASRAHEVERDAEILERRGWL